MLDVHPPHHPTHGWRDFFIHIATIVVGLIIAVGLEQTVEYLHHREQREQLELDLVAEAKNNLELIDLNDRYVALEQPIITALQRDLRELQTHPAAKPSPVDIAGLLSKNEGFFFPDAPVWNTAKEGDLVALLTRHQAAAYDLVYTQQALITVEYPHYEQRLADVHDFCLRFTATPGQPLDLTRIPPEELREYSTLLARLQGELERFQHANKLARGVTQAATQGNPDDQKAFEQIGVPNHH